MESSQTENYYDIIAAAYPELHREEQLRKLRIISGLISPKPWEKMLDVGCGPAYSADVFDCLITGVDPSRKLLEQGSHNSNFTPVLGVAESLPFPDSSFDYVISVTAIQNFSDIRRAVSEMWRVARSLVVVSCLARSMKLSEVRAELRRRFIIEKEIIEGHDIIFLLRKI